MRKATKHNLKVVDLFCGIGGLSYGLIKEGCDVVAGIDNDASCKYGFEHNNKAKFIHKDIQEVTAKEIDDLFGYSKNDIRILAGCAPCQPYSSLNPKGITKNRLDPVEKFARLIEDTLPDIVSMENVVGLAKMRVFKSFLNTLEANGYKFKYEIIDASDYGVPQKRIRLVLLASRLGEIELINKTHENKKVTVRKAIGNLEPIKDGETSETDPLHRARKLSPVNLLRIKATPINGGSSRSWNQDLILECHKKESGKTYRGTVYGRMRWDEPAPTMTTHCVGIGNGRFGHPEQDRAISLREAATLQTFPRGYEFLPPGEPLYVAYIAKFIGNALPVRLGVIIGRSIKNHVRQYVS